jgi:hypothetical protein
MPAPRNPIPVTSWAAILDVELGSIWADKYVNIIEPAITKQCVLIPAALPLDSLSAPIRNPASNERPMPIRKSSSYPL